MTDRVHEAIPAPDDPRILRHVAIGATGYRLLTWDTNRRDELGKSVLGYVFGCAEQPRLFLGEDFSCSPGVPVDADATLRALIEFLTLCPGDTDPEYFDSYTMDQLAWCDSDDCAEVHLWSLDPDRDSDSLPFTDLTSEPWWS